MMPNYNTFSDQDLVALLKKGDHMAFSELYDRYRGVLYVHIKRMLSNQHESMDVIQEVFTHLWVKKEELHFTTSVKAYLYTAVRNKVFNILAHRKFERGYLNSLESIINQGSVVVDENFHVKELIKLIDAEIGQLPERMREVFELSRKLYLSHKEIAERLNISEHTVKKQINNALHILRPKINLIVAVFPFF